MGAGDLIGRPLQIDSVKGRDRVRSPHTIWITLFSLAATAGAALLLPIALPLYAFESVAPARWALTVSIITVLVWAAQSWRVAIRGTRGDVSISMALDVATMLMMHPFIAATGSALGTGLYHLFSRASSGEHRPERAVVRGVITFAAVALGGWFFHTLRPLPGPLIFDRDWVILSFAIGLRLGIRVIFYPLGMAALRKEPVLEQLRYEWNKLPLVPFMLTTTLGGLAALIWQTQPAAIVLLLGPVAATWAATREFSRLNELLATLEDKVTDRTARLGETVRALERRLSEFEALNAVGQAMVQAIHPDEVLGVITLESARVTKGTSALVTLLSEERDRQFVRSAYGAGIEPFVGVELPIQGSLAGLVIQTGEAQVSLDPPNDRRLNPDLVREGKWRHVIEAPVRAKDQVMGVLVVASSKPEAFDEEHLRLLSLLANQAGIFLENARLHEKGRNLAVLEERNRIARELHDSVTQVLFSLTLNLEAAAGLQDRKPDKAAALVTRSQEMAAEALAEMRSLIFELRPSALQEKGLSSALNNHINLFRRRQGVEVTLTLEGEERLSPEQELCLYRVAQEALNNVSKHARAGQVSICLSVQDGAATLLVQDDGVGFDPASEAGAQSFGMIGMQERLEALDGTLTVTSAPGQGVRILARIPLA